MSDPLTDAASKYSLNAVVFGIADDLVLLRAGKISVKDAQTRALLAKQYMNGVRLVLNARKSLEDMAKQATLPARDGEAEA